MRNHAFNLGNVLWSGPVGPLRYPEVAITGTITLDSSAWNRMHVCSGTSANYTVTLPACAGHAGGVIAFRMATGLTKLVTLDGNASELIDGIATRIMWAAESAFLLCDGSNWFKISGKPRPMTAQMRITANQTGIANNTVTKILLSSTDLDNTQLMSNTTNNRIDIVRTSAYVISGVVNWYFLTAAGIRMLTLLYKNVAGTELSRGEQYGALNAYPGVPAFTSAALAVGDYIELLCFQNTGVSEDIVGTASAAACLLNVTEQPSW